MTKYIRIDYVVKPDVDLDELKGAIADFVAGIRAHHPEHRYTSFQHPSAPLRFIHIGEVVQEVLTDLQKQPFFLRFTGYLKEQCSIGPDLIAWLLQSLRRPPREFDRMTRTRDGRRMDYHNVSSAAAGS
jgi:hypothetical protein